MAQVVSGREIIMKRVALYIRVSTSRQDTENQRRELEAVADRSDWKIVKVYEDAGISGARALQRPLRMTRSRSSPGVSTRKIKRLHDADPCLLSPTSALERITDSCQTPRQVRNVHNFRSD